MSGARTASDSLSAAVENSPDAWSQRALADTPWDAACWSEVGQDIRFRTVSGLLHRSIYDVTMAGGVPSLLDFGCGTGNFELYVEGWVDVFAYDWSEGMRRRARREHERLVVLDELTDDLEPFDHVVCIGPFNLRDRWSKNATWDKLEELWALYTRATLTVSLFRGASSQSMLSYTTHDALRLVESLGSPGFRLVTDHLANDLILHLVRPRERQDRHHGAPAELPAGDVDLHEGSSV